MNILNLILAIILPPVGAFLQVGASKHFFINIILTLLGYDNVAIYDASLSEWAADESLPLEVG